MLQQSMKWTNSRNNAGALTVQAWDGCLIVKHESFKPVKSLWIFNTKDFPLWGSFLRQAFVNRAPWKAIFCIWVVLMGTKTLVWSLVSGSISLCFVITLDFFKKTGMSGDIFLKSMGSMNAGQRLAFLSFWMTIPFVGLILLSLIGVPVETFQEFLHLLLWSSYGTFNLYLVRLLVVLWRENLNAMLFDAIICLGFLVFIIALFYCTEILDSLEVVTEKLQALFILLPRSMVGVQSERTISSGSAGRAVLEAAARAEAKATARIADAEAKADA